jgi:WD40 repeat protein
VASGSADQSICLWNFEQQHLHKKLTGHSRWVQVLAFASNFLLSGSDDEKIIEWNFNTGEQISRLKADGQVICLDISEDQTLITAGLSSGKIQVWKNRTSQTNLTGHTKFVNAVLFANRNTRIISASEDKTVRVWSIDQECQIANFTNHSNFVNCLTRFSDDRFISGSTDFTMIIWNTSTLTSDSVISSQPVRLPESFIDENHLLCPSGQLLQVWNLNNNCLEAEFRGHTAEVLCLACDSDFVASGSKDKTIRVWNLRTGLQVTVFHGHKDFVYGVAMSGDIAASGSFDKTVRIWNIREQKAKGVLEGHTDRVLSVAVATDAGIVVSGSFDKPCEFGMQIYYEFCTF